ncbi:MAG: DUF3971 domain-containing protein [Rugosibacter sp.]|nr:DUF3971 domain-containing protein [Rugosibacter sp.]
MRVLSWGVTLLYFAVAFFVLALRYGVLPQIENYRGNIEQALSTAIKQPVYIRAIDAHWAGLRPVLNLHGVEIRDTTGHPLLNLEHVTAEPAWDSLLYGELRLARLELLAPHIELSRNKEGRFFAAGLEITPQKDNQNNFSNWLFAQHQIVIRDAAITWQDALRNAPPLELKHLDFQLNNSRSSHRFGLTAEPPRALATRLDIRGNLQSRDLKQLATWSGETYAEIDYADLAGWRAWVDYPVAIPQGSGALRLWLNFANAQLTAVTADVRLADVRLQLRPNLPELDLLKLDGRLFAERFEGGLSGYSKHLTLSTRDGLTLPPTNIELRWQNKIPQQTTLAGLSLLSLNRWNNRHEKNQPNGSFTANRLDLDTLSKLVIFLPLDEITRMQLNRYSPQGELTDLSLSWQGAMEHLQQWSINSRMKNFGLSNLGPIAHISGINGQIAGTNQEGTVDLDGKNSTLVLPTILAEPNLALDAFSTQAKWKNIATGLSVQLIKTTFSNSDAAGEASGTWHALTAGPGEIDLVARLTRSNGNAVWRYMPLAVSQETRDWLHHSILAGTASEVSLALKGDLRRFPFRGGPKKNQGGLFEVRGKFHAVTLDYATGWPDITGIDGELLFAGERMLITGNTGRIFGVDLRDVRAEIVDLETPEELLTVTGKAAGPTTDFLRYIEASPVGERIDHFTENMKAVGNGELDIKLDLPLRLMDDAKVAGKYRFDGNRLTVDTGLPPLADVHGQLQFSADHLEARDIRGTLQGMPLAVNIATSDSGVQISAAGEFNVVALRRQFAHPILDHLSGSAKWRGDVQVKNKSVDVKITSNLVGLSSSLPEPFNKSAKEPLATSFERHTLTKARAENVQKVGAGEATVLQGGRARNALLAVADGDMAKPSRVQLSSSLPPPLLTPVPQDLLDIRVGPAARLQLARRQDVSPSIITQGLLTLGDVNANMPEQQLLVAMNLPKLDADAWRRLLLVSSGDNQQAATSLPPVQFDLRVSDLKLFDKNLHDVRATGSRADAAMARGELKSRELSGTLEWQSAGKGKLIARLDKFSMPETSVAPASLQAQTNDVMHDLPALDIRIDELSLKNRPLGSVHVTAENLDAAWHTAVNIKNDDDSLLIKGRWHPSPEQSETQIDFDLTSRNIEKTLSRLGYPESLRSERIGLTGNLTWHGAPLSIDYPSLNGKLKIDAGKGQIKKLDPGVGRLLGIFSLQTLIRRVTLDFRDIFGEGFAFDSIRGEFDFINGIMSTSDLKIQAPSARIFLKGKINLINETQNLQARVQPALGESMAVGAMLANPIAGAAVWAAQKILQDPFGQIFTFEYQITGPWANPKIDKINQMPMPSLEAAP